MSSSPAVPPDISTEVPEELRRRLRTLKQRYGRQRSEPAGYRLELAVNRRRHQLAEIRKQIAELEQRAKVVESELNGFGKGMAALVLEEIAEYERTFPEAWSPTAVLGFRLWIVDDGRLVGARQVWDSPEFAASCAAHPGSDEVPHTDERCGRLGCGVYATKSLDPLFRLHLRETDRNYAVGLIAMSGKVVEHEDGYRAARAEVLSLVLIGKDRAVYSANPATIAAIFEDPETALTSSSSRAITPPVLARIEEHLMERKDQPWI
ncbi:MAG TPA: hypothetical protein VLT15_13680 [Acidimicrobiia bacterium]|nr:hypothetical protein [Acidimicrobiia bacterium]